MQWFLVVLVVSAAVAVRAEEGRKSYEGYQLIKVVPNTRAAVELLRNLMFEDVTLDFFTEPSAVGKDVEILVPPGQLRHLAPKLMKEHMYKIDITVQNYQTVLDPMWEALDQRKNAKGGMVFNLNDFNTIEDINSWMQTTLLAQCRNGFNCEVVNIGQSAQGRPMLLFKLSKPGAGRKAYWIDAGIHAREWISPATVVNVLDNLVNGRNAAGVDLADRYDWYVLPVMNVDGYAYTFTNDRQWRKNRKANAGSTCIGTDLNRNFNFRWGNDGVSFNPCSDQFCGSGAGSEPETQAVQNYITSIGGGTNVLALVTVHSYGNMFMFPWGNTVNYAGVTCQRSDDHNQLMVVANAAANAIQATYNTQWDRGNSCEVIYATTGGTDDWGKGVAGIANSFCPELRGNAFVIPASQIAMSYAEFFNGIVAMVNSING